MQCPSVERTFCNLLYVYGRGRRRCGGPTILAIRCCAFPLVGNAHRAFRGGKLVRMIFGRSTGKHKIDGTNTQCNYFNPCNVRPSNARFCNLLYVYGRGRRRCGGPTILAIRRCAFPLVGNAHLVGAKIAKLRPALRRVTSARLSCSSSRQKVSLGSAVRL